MNEPSFNLPTTLRRRASVKSLDVVDELVGQALYGLFAGPGDVRGQYEVGQLQQLHQRMAVFGRFRRRDIEAGPADLPGPQRLDERGLVDQAAARRIDQQGLALHQGEFGRADQVAGAVVQGAVQSDDVAFSQQLLERRIQTALLGRALAPREEYAHAQRPTYAGDRLAQGALADNAQRGASKILDGIVEIAELLGVVPAPRLDGFAIRHDAAPQGEDEREGVFGSRYAPQ